MRIQLRRGLFWKTILKARYSWGAYTIDRPYELLDIEKVDYELLSTIPEHIGEPPDGLQATD
jgi:hypothetical protein